MRIALISGVLLLALGTGALAETRSSSHERESRSRYSFDFDLTLNVPLALNPFYDPFQQFDHPNDRGGYRVFIPRGPQGREYYNVSSGYQGGRAGRVRGHYDRGNHYRRDNAYNNGYRYRNRRYNTGGYTILQGQPYWDGYGWSYGYGNPTTIYPGRSAIVIDPNGSNYIQPPGEVYYDNRVYDNDVYDNSETVNNYNYAPPQREAPAQRSAPSRPQVGPVQPKAEPIGPQQAVQPKGRAVAVRFGEQGRINTPDGARVYEIKDAVLYTKNDDGKREKIASGVDADFGGYAVLQPEVGSAVIFRQGDKLVAAYPTETGWWVEPLNYKVNFAAQPSFNMMAGEPWVTFTATDGTRWVIKLSDHQWIEVGSGTK